MKYLYKYPAERISLRRSGWSQSAARSHRTRIRVARYRRIQRRPLLRRVRGIRKSRARRHSDPDQRVQSRTGCRSAACAADLLVPQHLDMVARSAKAVSADAAGNRRHRGIVGTWQYFLHCEGRPALLFTENETNNQRLFGTANASPYVKDGINDYVVAGQAGGGQSEPDRNQGRRALPARPSMPGDTAVIRLRLSNAAPTISVRSGFEQILETAPARGRRVLSGDHAGRCRRRCGQCDAAGAGRHAVEQAVFLPRCRQVARRTWRRSDAADAPGAQPRVVPHDQRPCHLDAGQVGISLVRRLGPGLPHDRTVDRRSSISPSSSSTCCWTRSTCIRPGRSLPMSGTSAMSTRRCRPGPRSFSTAWSRRCAARPISIS